MRLKTRVQKFATAGARKKAKIDKQVGPDSFQWLLAQDVAKEKRKREAVDEWDGQPRITFVFSTNSKLNPAFLGPSLKMRFLDDS